MLWFGKRQTYAELIDLDPTAGPREQVVQGAMKSRCQHDLSDAVPSRRASFKFMASGKIRKGIKLCRKRVGTRLLVYVLAAA